MRKIKRDDEVIVIAGRDKGKRGTVIKVLSDHLVVSGVNFVKKHQKPNPSSHQPGGIIKKEVPISVSNVAMFNPLSGKGDRVGFKILENGQKVRIFKSSGEIIGA